jgi:alpha-amylase
LIIIIQRSFPNIVSDKQVRAEIKKWALWLVNTFNLSGIRFDAVKHFSEDFQVELLQYLNANIPRDLFYVGIAALFLP